MNNILKNVRKMIKKKIFFNQVPIYKDWQCFICEEKHPKTLRYCPICNIAKIHSDNLRKTTEKNKKK